jgi:phospholipid-binding lipoprotein MlaA
VSACSRIAAGALALSLATPALASAAGAPGDPLEPMNRAIFKFNDTLDVWILEPVAKGWNFVVPGRLQEGLDNFFENLRFPVVFVNSVLQAKPTAAGTALGRFTINTVFGLAGLFDPAQSAGLDPVDEDFGQTLGRWGVGGGPYLVLPLLGPSNIRDGLGLGVDAATRVWPYLVDREVVWAVTGINVINTRSLYLDVVRDAKRDSLDYYSAVRDAYLQRRADLIADRRSGDNGEEPEDDDDDDLYYPDGDDADDDTGNSEDDDLYYPEVD